MANRSRASQARPRAASEEKAATMLLLDQAAARAGAEGLAKEVERQFPQFADLDAKARAAAIYATLAGKPAKKRSPRPSRKKGDGSKA